MRGLALVVSLLGVLAACGTGVGAAAVSTVPWRLIASSNLPKARQSSLAMYCGLSNSVYMLYGYEGSRVFSTSVFKYSLAPGLWTLLPSAVNQPPTRVWSTLTSLPDSAETNRCSAVMMFGATPVLGDLFDMPDVHHVSVDANTDEFTWTKLNFTSGPQSRDYHAAVYRRGKVILFGGTRISSQEERSLNDMWELTIGDLSSGADNSSTWRLYPPPTGNSGSRPPGRFGHSMSIYLGDTPDDDKLVVYAGRTDVEYLSDLWVFSFGTNTWKLAPGLRLQRSGHASIIHDGVLFVFGGAIRVQGSPFTFNDVLVTAINTTKLNPTGGLDLSVGSLPYCADSSGNTGLWCEAVPGRGAPVPATRSDFAWAQNGPLMYVFGGTRGNLIGDFWELNTSEAILSLGLADADPLGISDLASTMYFMIAILAMMVICFIVFIVSLRRQRSTHPMFTMQVVRQRVVGARPSVIEALPLKTYRKADRPASQRVLVKAVDPAEGAEASSVEGAAAAAAAKPPATEDPESRRIEQDDLHDLCAICLCDYEDGEQLRVLPCSHFFHPPCVDQWLRTHNACPMCKAAVDLDPERSEAPPENQIVPVEGGPAGEGAENPNFRDGASAVPSEATRDPASAAVDRQASDATGRPSTNNVQEIPLDDVARRPSANV